MKTLSELQEAAAMATSEGMGWREKSAWRYARKKLGLEIPLRAAGRRRKEGGRFDARSSPFVVRIGKNYYKMQENMVSRGVEIEVPMIKTKR